MDITPLLPSNYNRIKSYSDNGFTIADKEFFTNIIISATHIVELNKFSFSEETVLTSLLDNDSNFTLSQAEILLIGSGKSHQLVSKKFKSAIKEKFPNLSIDVMSSHAACRTFNVLISEDRAVVAIIIC